MNMQSFFLEIAEISLGMSLLIPLMLLVLRFVGRKFTVKCRYILWTLVLLRLTIPFSLGFLPALIEVPVEPIEPINEVQIEVQPDLTVPVPEYIPPQIPQGIVIQPQTPVPSPVVPSVHEIPEAEEQPDEATAEQPTEVTWELILNILTAVYCAGAALFFGWNIVSYIVYAHKILRAGREPSEHVKTVYAAICSSVRLRRIPRLLLSQDVNSPAAFGILRRHIILPDIEFTDNALTGTLMHEVTHCRRGDLYIKVCTLFARSLHWFNPLVHLAAYRCEMEMELSCDEAVLAGCSDETRAAYGEMMLDIIRRCRQKRGTLTTHFNPKKNAVKARLTNILYGSGKLHGRWLIAVCLILCLAAGTIVACRVEGEEVNEPDEATEKGEGTEEKGKNESPFWTYALTDTVSLSYNTDDEGAYILSASDENGEPYPLTEVSGDILQFGNSSTLREVLPLSHRTTEDGYLFYFRYHIQYAYFYEITLIHKEDRLEYSSIRRIEQEEAEELGVISTEMVTVTSLEELADYRDNYIISESVYDFYYNLLSGESEIPEYNTVHIEEYSIRFTVPMTEYSTYFSFTVTESGLDTLPEGTYDWQVSDLREVSVDYSHYDNTEYLDIPEVQKLFAYFLSMYAYNTPTYGADKMPYHAIHQYICDYHGEGGAIPRDDFCRIAETEFGITDSTVFDLESWSEPDGRIYSGGIGGGFTGEILDVTENSDEVTVTMQFYADWNSFLKSHKIAYRFGKNGTWLGYEILDISSREPHGMHFEEETTGTAYTIAIKQLKGRMKQMNSDGTLPAHEYKLHVTGMSVPVTLTMSRDHVTAVEAHGYKVQLQTPLDIYGNCDFELFEADGAVIIEGGVYRIGDIYVLSPEGTGESHPGSESSYYLWLDENGQLKYHLTNNYAAPIIQTGALSAAVGYDEFWYASGDAEIVSGKIVYAPPTVSETISDRYDPDEEFRTLYQGIYGNFNHIDEVFEMNRWRRILERDRPAAADIYRTFLDTVIAPYTEYIASMEYIDLDGNNIDELILYSRNAGVSSAAEIYTIEDGEVCSFSNSGISVITTGSDAPKALAKPSRNANDFRFFGLPTSSENRQMLSFQPCFYGGVPYTILCSYNEHETMKSTIYYSFTRDINNLLDVAPLGTYTMEAVSSDPSPGWNCYVNGQPVTGQQYMDSMKKLWTSIYIRYSVRYTEENTISGFDLLREPPKTASEPLREVLHTFSTHLPMVYLSMNGSSPLHGWDSAPVTQQLSMLSSSYTFEPLTAVEEQGTTPITLTSSDGTWSLDFRENSNDFSLTIGSETYWYRASASFTGQPEPIGTLLGITCLSRSIEETLLTGKDHISAFLADGYTVTEENGVLRMQSPDPELTDTILFRPEWELHDFRWLGYEPIGSMKYRSSWQMSITNTANGEYGVLYFAAEFAEEAGTLKLKGIDLS